MANSGPIIIAEDDADDKELLEDIIRELGYTNEIRWFQTTESAFEYLSAAAEPVFVIFSDINMPHCNGLEFKARIDADESLRRKSIPFIFYATAADQQMVDEAYNKLTVQGFFKKAHSYGEMKQQLNTILSYWTHCFHPNSGNC